MIVELNNTNDCSHTGSVLVDLGTYFDVNVWMKAVIHGRTAFRPYLCGIKFNNDWHYLITAGHPAVDSTEIVDQIRRLPIAIRKIPNNDMKITVDAQENTMYIELG